MNFGWLMGFRL